MRITEPIPLLIELLERNLIEPEDVIRWSGNVLEHLVTAKADLPAWLLEICALRSPFQIDFISRLAQRAPARLSLHERIQLTALVCNAGFVPFAESMHTLHRLILGDCEEEGALLDRLLGLLRRWEQWEEDHCDDSVYAELVKVLDEYVADAGELVETLTEALPWKFAGKISPQSLV